MTEVISSSPVEVVVSTPDDWTILRDFKINSLEVEPVAFENPDVAIERYKQRPEAEWRYILSGGMSGGRSGESVVFFAQEGGVPIGMISAIIPEGKNTALIQHTYVQKEHRSKGAGKQLLAKLLEYLKSKGAKKATLDVVETQGAAIHIYEKLGLKKTGINEGVIDWVEPPLDEICMEITI